MKEKILAYLRGMHLSWTVWFGYLLIVLPYVQAEWRVFGSYLPEVHRETAFALIGLAVVLLRFKTTQSLASK